MVKKQENYHYSFLDLPVEIRIMIYQYLIPDNIIRSHQLRQDGQPCGPALLRVNSTIYREMLHEWYSARPYELYLIFSGGISFNALSYPAGVPLPATLRAVTSLRVVVSPCKVPDYVAKMFLADIEIQQAYIQREKSERLAETLSSPEMQRTLKHLEIAVKIGPPHRMQFRSSPEILYRALDWVLSPIRDVVRVRSVDVGFKYGSVGNSTYASTLVEERQRLDTIMNEYLSDMRDKMLIRDSILPELEDPRNHAGKGRE